MELGGDEKRIQALFSELSLEDRSRAPQFGHLWTRVQASRRAVAPVGEKTLIRLLVLLLITAAFSVAAWVWSRTPSPPNTNIANYVPQSVADEVPIKIVPERIKPQSQKHIARRRKVDRGMTEVALLSSWQSPTQSFMTSPTDLALSSLPQLNQSVKDLESFLPKNNEIMKESNQ